MKKGLLFVVVVVFLALLYPPFHVPSAACSGLPAVLNPAAQNPDSAGSEEIEKKVREIIRELERLRKEASEKIRKEILPLIEKELERLEKWLRDLRLNRKGEPETRET